MSTTDRKTSITYITEQRPNRRAPRWYRAGYDGPQVGDEYISDGQTITRAREVPLGTVAVITTTILFKKPQADPT